MFHDGRLADRQSAETFRKSNLSPTPVLHAFLHALLERDVFVYWHEHLPVRFSFAPAHRHMQ